MKQAFRLSVLAAFSLLAFVPAPAFAATKPSGAKPVAPLGIDISYPQCRKSVPTSQAFGIVGVNGGTAAKANPCLSAQLGWAGKSLGGTAQDKIQLYVNTASPGQYIADITTWPVNNVDQSGFDTQLAGLSYGICDGTDSVACAWQYGWNRAYAAVNEYFAPAALIASQTNSSISTDPTSYAWWLDVETLNTWQDASATDGYKKNAASLEGMTSYYSLIGVKKVGLYSTNYQWDTIVGDAVSPTSVLSGLDTWYALGRTTKDTATAACTSIKYRPLTGSGTIVMTQFVSNNLDYNVSCV